MDWTCPTRSEFKAKFRDSLGICQRIFLLPTAPSWVCSVQQLGWFSDLIMKLDMSSDGTNGKIKATDSATPTVSGWQCTVQLKSVFHSLLPLEPLESFCCFQESALFQLACISALYGYESKPSFPLELKLIFIPPNMALSFLTGPPPYA